MQREFNMSFKQDIIKGKVEVVTDCGEPVEIVKWNCKGNYPILAVIDEGDTSDSCFYDEEGLSSSKKERIYVLTDEPELTEFEDKLGSIILLTWDVIKEREDCKGDVDDVKQWAKELLDIARKELEKTWDFGISNEYDKGYAHGHRDALNDMPKWKVATENLSIGCLVWNKSGNFHLYNDEVYEGELYISIADILRLPGSPKEK